VVRFVRGSQFASVSCAAVALLQRPLRLLGFSAPAPAVFELQTERTAIKLFVWHPGRVFCFCGYTEKMQGFNLSAFDILLSNYCKNI